MSLESRKTQFAEITSKFKCEQLSPFIAVHQMNPDLYENLRTAAAIFISRFMHPTKVIIDDRTLLVQTFAAMAQRGEILNCTPNGLMVPKRHVTLEYNAVVKAYFEILRSLGIKDHIITINPPSMRYKEGEADFDKRKMERGYASEKAHLDSWTGDCPSSVNVSIPLFGDAERNHVIWWSVPDNFEEDWLKYKPSYDAGARIKESYLPLRVDYPHKKGSLYMIDVAVLHQTQREKGAGARFTIDNLFTVSDPPPDFNGRLGKHFSDLNIGETNLLVSQLGLKEVIQNSPNRLPLDLELVKII